MKDSTYSDWFCRHTGFTPHPWQAQLAGSSELCNRLIRIPTGFGKTQGVLAAWAYNRLVRRDASWPRRLILCLPMRVLVEQTEAAVCEWLARDGLLWAPGSSHTGRVGVHVLMGGRSREAWHLYPEHEAVLIGTQDMLLSRALNRGYACGRARWPMEYAQLHQDALWVLDEVQLMGVGLATSSQFQAFRSQEAARSLRPTASWWMSATLQPRWLQTADQSSESVAALTSDCLRIPAKQRVGPLWAVDKPCEVIALPHSGDKQRKKWAAHIATLHQEQSPGPYGRVTLALANTVDGAVELYRNLVKQFAKHADPPELRLVHSRFRGHERDGWRTSFLQRSACTSGANRIVVATQVVEAGVDMSATTLVTPLAPWSSLVQRFGRAARYGGSAKIVVVDRQLADDRAAAPYSAAELVSARAALGLLTDVSPRSLEALEAELERDNPSLLTELYPYNPAHVLTREEYGDLFDTGPDLTGADIDISRFIRDGEDRDVLVWWSELPPSEPPPASSQPERADFCRVSLVRAKKWLFASKQAGSRRAFSWDYQDGAWKRLDRADLYPGQVVLVDADFG
ncbi:MAG: type I-G CRISPR-associated helicase/endonuclease Cas3g, partial [Nannocystaceae bacterium]